MSETSELIQCLKRSLRQHGVTYAQLTEPLGLSEASVKRLFAEESFSLKRIETICQHIGISFSDLLVMLEEKQDYISQFTNEQEREIISDDRLIMVTQLVFSDWQFDDILRVFTMTKPELIRVLIKLEKIGLIELLPNNRFKLLTAHNFRWRKDGPVQTYFRENIQTDFFLSDFTDPNEDMNFLTGMLSPDAYIEFTKKLDDLIKDFDRLCREDSKRPLNDRLGYAVVLAIRPWTLGLFKEFVKTPPSDEQLTKYQEIVSRSST